MTFAIQKHSLRLDTQKYTAKDILDEVLEDRDLLVYLGYPEMANYTYEVQISTRAKRQLGYCQEIGVNHYKIVISDCYLRKLSPAEIHNTIMHEVCHSAPGCMNHGPKWIEVARKVNARFEFTPITRFAYGDEVTQVFQDNKKYFIVCKNCNRKYGYIRRPKYWDAYSKGLIKCSCCRKPFTTEMKL